MREEIISDGSPDFEGDIRSELLHGVIREALRRIDARDAVGVLLRGARELLGWRELRLLDQDALAPLSLPAGCPSLSIEQGDGPHVDLLLQRYTCDAAWLVQVDPAAPGRSALFGGMIGLLPDPARDLPFLELIASYCALLRKQEHLVQRLEHLATTDPLTGVPNRRALMGNLDVEVSRARRHERPLAILMADLDGFKVINDRFGHEQGDAVLRRVGGILADSLRASDHCGRYGGEEFVVLLPETDHLVADTIAERLRRRVEHFGRRYALTVSIGAASLKPNESSDELLSRADRALYQAKRRGRNRTEYSAA